MLESYTGKGLTVRWSIEELTVLYHAFGVLGTSLWDGFEERGVLAYFSQIRTDRRPGTMGVDMDAPPPDLNGPEARRFLARLMELAAAELALDEPNPRAFGRTWTRDDRLRWISRLSEMYEIMRRTSPDMQIPEYQLLLTGPDQAETQIFLYLAYYEELERRPDSDPRDCLAFIDTIITMIAEAGLETRKADLLTRLRKAREEMVEKLGLNQHRRQSDQAPTRRATDVGR